jgi:hypothetical protein
MNDAETFTRSEREIHDLSVGPLGIDRRSGNDVKVTIIIRAPVAPEARGKDVVAAEAVVIAGELHSVRPAGCVVRDLFEQVACADRDRIAATRASRNVRGIVEIFSAIAGATLMLPDLKFPPNPKLPS